MVLSVCDDYDMVFMHWCIYRRRSKV